MDKVGVHHFWIGIFLLCVGFVALLNLHAAVWTICTGLGIWLCVDDTIQHRRQIKHPEYRSPVNRLYGATLYKIKWIRDLNKFFDKLFGA